MSESRVEGNDVQPSKAMRVVLPMFLFLLFFIPSLLWDRLFPEQNDVVIDSINSSLRQVAYSLAGLSMAWLCVRMLDILFWDGIAAKRLGAPVPRLLKDVVAATIFLAMIACIAGIVFQLPVTGILATSSVIGLVLGLATRTLIADLFSGIAINLDNPFKIGEYVRIRQRGIPEIIGAVVEINWRATRIRSKDNLLHIVPNSVISGMAITNLDRPQIRSRFDLWFTMDFDVPHERAMRVLNAAVKSAWGVLPEPAPQARIDKITSNGVDYKVRYWLEPDKVSPNKGRNAVCSSVLEHLNQAGMTLAIQKHDVFPRPHAEQATGR